MFCHVIVICSANNECFVYILGLLMDQGLLIGLVVVGVAVLLALVAAMYCCFCRNRYVQMFKCDWL